VWLKQRKREGRGNEGGRERGREAGGTGTWQVMQARWAVRQKGRRSGITLPLTSRSQGQASSTTSNEVVQGVIGLLPDLGADARGEAKHGSHSSCRSTRRMGAEPGAQWGSCGSSLEAHCPKHRLSLQLVSWHPLLPVPSVPDEHPMSPVAWTAHRGWDMCSTSCVAHAHLQ
jgi:hypothetical protein